MQGPITLPEVPNSFPSMRDITLYASGPMGGPAFLMNTNLRKSAHFDTPAGATMLTVHSRKGGSSLEGQRSITDFFHILDHHIKVENADEYKLRQLDNLCRPLVGPPIERSSSGNIIA